MSCASLKLFHVVFSMLCFIQYFFFLVQTDRLMFHSVSHRLHQNRTTIVHPPHEYSGYRRALSLEPHSEQSSLLSEDISLRLLLSRIS